MNILPFSIAEGYQGTTTTHSLTYNVMEKFNEFQKK